MIQQLTNALAAAGQVRLTAASALTVVAVYWTYERARGDRDDPSLSFGRDWVLVRFSGLPLVALVVGVLAVVLWPALLAEGGWIIALGLAALIAFWIVAKWREAMQ